MFTIGVLSDTHLTEPDKWFSKKAALCFADADMILHAGDLTSLSVLDVFAGKIVHAVHGNMCGPKTRNTLPSSKVIEVGDILIGLTHGVGYMPNIEDRLFDHFGPIDCIVYGHTHRPVCHRYGPTLMVNPGSFTATGTYGVITVEGRSLAGEIRHIKDAS